MYTLNSLEGVEEDERKGAGGGGGGGVFVALVTTPLFLLEG